MSKKSLLWFPVAAVVLLITVACAAPGAPPATPVPPTPTAPVQATPPAATPAVKPTPTPGPSQALAQLYEAAKKEGEVRFQGPLAVEIMDPLLKAFEKQYPGVKIAFTNKTAGQTATQIITEAPSGRFSIDLAMTFTSGIAQLIERGLLESFKDWATLGVPADFIQLDGRYLKYFELPTVIGYNTKLVAPADVPKSWDDLLAPRWKGGKILVDARGHFIETHPLDPSWGEEKVLKFAASLKQQEPIYVERMAQAVEQLAAGQAPLGTVVLAQLLQKKDQGAPIDLAPLTPVQASSFGLSVVKGAPHPNAAKLLAAWLVTPEARKLLEEVGYYAMASPCNISRAAQFLCDKNVRIVMPKTLEEAAKVDKWSVQIQEAMGTRR